ncbi:uncharacterized protein TRIADDRAFT_32080 [Trichoplax adhaerens]|uniref:MIR domain-containing protein n=1 Tax=Trichoplax adhaerens TaxID=10228 RepID=B3S9Y2_TRIAD|nr:hypothetical protein TRIADDRAFT_32080 [Trichoplax adhaerens]EDV20345.1 hypothetical protein TRIADDRAFT_32080 [Trichoplax adhaerens]|eukprot:XP_002117039.1 hypothetical protein TRIADDRAFT_32080 [Trichoplax adhaerens]
MTCGSAVKLVNIKYNARLHSHDVKYGSGSGQQSVTGQPAKDDVNSYWIIKGPHGKDCLRGTAIKCGATIRLMHAATESHLHSHHFPSPLSHNKEVSCFGGKDKGDHLDNWMVVCNTNRKYWMRDEQIRLKHVELASYLHLTGDVFGRPINGQYEISGYHATERGNLWKAAVGPCYINVLH